MRCIIYSIVVWIYHRAHLPQSHTFTTRPKNIAFVAISNAWKSIALVISAAIPRYIPSIPPFAISLSNESARSVMMIAFDEHETQNGTN